MVEQVSICVATLKDGTEIERSPLPLLLITASAHVHCSSTMLKYDAQFLDPCFRSRCCTRPKIPKILFSFASLARQPRLHQNITSREPSVDFNDLARRKRPPLIAAEILDPLRWLSLDDFQLVCDTLLEELFRLRSLLFLWHLVIGVDL